MELLLFPSQENRITCPPDVPLLVINLIKSAVWDIGSVKMSLLPEEVDALPPWVQDGNDADPDERPGSFTENRQNWERCPDAG